MSINKFLLFLFSATLLCCRLGAADDLWTENFEQAKKTAAAQNKDILLDFTGSDWCGWCIKLKKEVFDTAAFKEAAPKKFVLVEIDFPQGKEQSAELKEQNQKLQQEFKIEGYPTIVLTDASGKPYARTGYQSGGPEAYLKHLDELQQVKKKRDDNWSNAEKAEGLEKAKLLAAGLKAMDEEVAANSYGSVIEEIKRLDPQDQTGITALFGFKTDVSKLQDTLKSTDSAQFRSILDKFLAEHPSATKEQKQEAIMSALKYCRPPKDNMLVKDLMAEVQKIDPDSELGKTAVLIQKRVDEMVAKTSSKATAEKKN